MKIKRQTKQWKVCGGCPGTFRPAVRDILPLSYSVVRVTGGDELQINLVHRAERNKIFYFRKAVTLRLIGKTAE
jgi:hypothetical protein